MKSLAVKYRPQTWDEVIGQESVVHVLTNQIARGTVRNCYLFVGSSGGGKTTVARLLANAINQGIGVPVEIDAASNSGVENVREIIKDSQERSLYGKYKVYILDEVHAFSTAAWQALLKTIEEPSEFTIFILCTTEPQKVPATILNRVQKFNFVKVPAEQIQARLAYICHQEQAPVANDVLELIAKRADGCVREALTILDKVLDYGVEPTTDIVLSAVGDTNTNTYFKLVDFMLDGKAADVLQVLSEVSAQGIDFKIFVDQFLRFILDVLKYVLFQTCAVTNFTSSMEPQLKNITNIENAAQYYNYVVDKLLNLKELLKNDADLKSTVEVVCLQITRMQ